ncbi:5-hydroxytryptamine receptor 2C isoform B [Patagioenas fasciata monilis]|uniref:5-hydroxytryptamine receptor 2C isoform B n=1 Tax=Patagioenas fasciata monilis TaxID=372326 RepID=A0A1V4KYP2_PATFA|nr:5-hydroxytryptamine receptor 2C isoform B [Patagioenas fasciata monilis]
MCRQLQRASFPEHRCSLSRKKNGGPGNQLEIARSPFAQGCCNLTLNQSLPTSDPLNASEKGEVSRMSVREKNWPALLILVVILLTIGGNILVIMAVSLEKKLQNATNFFLMSLAVADMLVGILVMPVSLITVLYGISMPIPVMGLQDDSRVFVNGTCVLNDENFVLIGSFMAFFIPLIIMVITYCLTIQVLQRQATVFMCGEVPRQRRSSVNCLKKENNTENISMLHNHEGASHLNSPVNKEAVLFRKGTMQSINNERRASKVLGIVFFLFLIMWCPFFITNVMSVLCKEACDKDLLSELLDVFVWVGRLQFPERRWGMKFWCGFVILTGITCTLGEV